MNASESNYTADQAPTAGSLGRVRLASIQALPHASRVKIKARADVWIEVPITTGDGGTESGWIMVAEITVIEEPGSDPYILPPSSRYEVGGEARYNRIVRWNKALGRAISAVVLPAYASLVGRRQEP